MKTINFTLQEGMQLEAELQAILALKAPVRLKYELTNTALKIQACMAAGRKLTEALFKDYGRPDTNNPDMLVLDEGSPALEDYKALLAQPLDALEYTPLRIEWFDGLESAYNFPVLYRLIGE
jgi:hypothetical protein